MIKPIKRFFKMILPNAIQDKIIHRDEYVRVASIHQALKHQRLFELYNTLSSIVPDITNQYTHSQITSDYYRTKVRAEHAFQISIVQKALRLLQLENKRPLMIVDIGDSCGTHLQYLKYLYKGVDTLSVNLDPHAVKRIIEKGLKAICARAEDIDRYSTKADICLSFEMLEHLFDPIDFLYRLSEKLHCQAFVVTVPYLVQSRVGMRHIRNSEKNGIFAEDMHVFELSPADWKLIFQHSGWAVVHEEIYLQYPRRGLLSLSKIYWRKIDYEGFYGVILSKDSRWKDLYRDWQK